LDIRVISLHIRVILLLTLLKILLNLSRMMHCHSI
jgi:hypothetical protein